MRLIVLPMLMLALAGCGKMSDEEMTSSLEKAWTQDPAIMAQLSGTKVPGLEPGALRGGVKTAKALTEIAGSYGGSVGRDIAQGAIEGVSGVAEDLGVEGAGEARTALDIATASDWTVRNLEILEKRDSGTDLVATVRYDLTVNIRGTPKTIGRDITHAVRFISADGDWFVETRP